MPRKERYPRTCLRCERQFASRFSEQLYCSRSCAARGPRPNRRRSQAEPRQCPCGTVFVPSAPRVRFCSMACGQKFGGVIREVTCAHCSATFATKVSFQRCCSTRCQLAARRQRTVRTCEFCGGDYHSLLSRQRFCSIRCGLLGKSIKKGSESPRWQGGRTLKGDRKGDPNPYVRRYAPDHPRGKRTQYVFEHILVMEQIVGRYLLPHERVHHRNGRRDDNRPENLELWKMKDPPGVRASDYHCAGCRCPGRGDNLVRLAEAKEVWGYELVTRTG